MSQMTDSSSSEGVIGGTWVATRSNVLGTYYRYEPRDSAFEAKIDSKAEFFCPIRDSQLDSEIERCEAELLHSASWLVFLKNQKLTGGGKNP